MSNPQEDAGRRFSLWRSLKLGSFHIGSSFADLLTSAVWNRVLISDLGVAAWPVALLSALRYFLAPLSLWAGRRSDTRPILGSRRVAYIWLGRLLMLLALPLLPLSTVAITRDTSSPVGWALAVLSFVVYGAGTLISGAPFLALVHDSAPYDKRGQAMGIVQLMLVVSFAFIPAVYAGVMPVYDPAAFARLVLIGMGGAALFWVFSVLGEEKRIKGRPSTARLPAGSRSAQDALEVAQSAVRLPAGSRSAQDALEVEQPAVRLPAGSRSAQDALEVAQPAVRLPAGSRSAQDALEVEQPSVREAVRGIWANPRARRYAIFLAASAFFAFMQDAMLEPFGGDVFGLAAGQTTRFNAYWGTGVIVGMIGTLILTRRRRPDQQVSTTSWGLALLALPLVLLGVVSLRETLPMVMPTLIFFGLGFGIFTVGGVSLLMAVNQESQAGTYLALWSVIQLISRGAGIAAGGIVRDVALALTGSFNAAYASVFLLEAAGLFVSIWLLQRVGVAAFASRARVSTAEVLAAAD